jgi:uncharacterized protein (DUF1684 family)
VSRPSWSCFLPFRDATSGNESYGAGRYLDVEPGRDGRVQSDFNLAYNPYCAYNDAFSCPLSPSENWLRVPIRAGEAAYTSASCPLAANADWLVLTAATDRPMR